MDVMPGMGGGPALGDTLRRGAGVSVGIPAVVVAAILHGEVHAANVGHAAIHDAALLMEGLGQMVYAAAAVVKEAIHPSGSENFALFGGVIGNVAAEMVGIPEEHADAHAPAGSEAEHVHDAQIVGVPEGERIIVETLRA